MKPMAPNVRRWTKKALLLAGGFSLGLAIGVAVADDLLPTEGIQVQGGVPYTSGGVGETERGLWNETGQRFNLLVATARPTGEYLSDVNVVIRNGHGVPVLNTVTQGPWLMVQLPPGKYTVEASNGNQTRHATVSVDRVRQSRVLMHLIDIEEPPPLAATTVEVLPW